MEIVHPGILQRNKLEEQTGKLRHAISNTLLDKMKPSAQDVFMLTRMVPRNIWVTLDSKVAEDGTKTGRMLLNFVPFGDHSFTKNLDTLYKHMKTQLATAEDTTKPLLTVRRDVEKLTGNVISYYMEFTASDLGQITDCLNEWLSEKHRILSETQTMAVGR